MEGDKANLTIPTEKAAQERTPGRSLFPIARVQKILKADKVRNEVKWSVYTSYTLIQELHGVAKEAVFLIAVATVSYPFIRVIKLTNLYVMCTSLKERFIGRVSEAARSQAGREKRATVQKKDICALIHVIYEVNNNAFIVSGCHEEG
jgi:DNA polymerase epsilon subunit 4